MSDWIKIGILVALVAAGIGAHFYLEHKAVDNAVIVTQTKIEKQYQDKLIAANDKATKAEADLAAFKVKSDKDKQDAIKSVDVQYASLVSSLQQRPTRADLTSSVAAAVARAKSSCTGAQLYREDAEFLAGEAARADKLIIERDYYYGEYEAARQTLAGQAINVGQHAQTNDTRAIP